MTAIVLAATVLLGGCSLFQSDSRMARANRGDPTAEARLAVGPATLEGRRALDEGRLAGAVESFQLALASGEEAAPAFNGMGVAFARMGRTDLAARFFNQAIALNPANDSYLNNLAILQRSREAELAAGTRLVQAPEPTPAAQAASPVPPRPEIGKLVQSGDRQFSLVTNRLDDQLGAATQPRLPTIVVARRKAATVAPDVLARFRPVVAVELADAGRTAAAPRPQQATPEQKRKVIDLSRFKAEQSVDFSEVPTTSAPSGRKPT